MLAVPWKWTLVLPDRYIITDDSNAALPRDSFSSQCPLARRQVASTTPFSNSSPQALSCVFIHVVKCDCFISAVVPTAAAPTPAPFHDDGRARDADHVRDFQRAGRVLAIQAMLPRYLWTYNWYRDGVQQWCGPQCAHLQESCPPHTISA